MFDYSRKNKRWRHLRARILREAGYRDQVEARYGRNVEATHVHHIWPAEDFPEYAYESWNLIAVSLATHDALHDRSSGQLSAAGESLRRRTIPPTPRE